MATLTVEPMTAAGLIATYVAADAGLADEFPNDGETFIHVKNGGVGAVTVTADDQSSSSPVGAEAFDADVVLTVAGSGEGFLGPFKVARFTRTCLLAWDQVDTVTLAVIRSKDV